MLISFLFLLKVYKAQRALQQTGITFHIMDKQLNSSDGFIARISRGTRKRHKSRGDMRDMRKENEITNFKGRPMCLSFCRTLGHFRNNDH